ncbi:hypothetical protein FHR90_002833 [Endobacter medicaginis]|jgi:hypothetical protein|uniref:Uncharacterized protein n=1 Tax=Endobacter medicaginis TaxID=1181271 RepID=A0A839UYW7_9PROT|nr:hypothetical protein [Endobacter medicaginis]MBB3174986.1 hypothetical protein [Endobacter medicaginis]MCX5475909.1 hypothetical protein [Endobacter medicaginis]NVN28837.1 hypothetical protein [Endobacter medicaginis]
MTAVDPTLLGPVAGQTSSQMQARMRAVLPSGWFAERGADPVSPTPVLDAVLAGQATAWVAIFAQLQAVFAQTRLASASGGHLEMISADFFGPALGRGAGESDDAYRARIRAALLPTRATRDALALTLSTLAQIDWRIVEPSRTADTGVISNAAGMNAAGGYGIGPMRYGSRSLDYGFLVEGWSDSTTATGLRTDRWTPATFIDGSGSMHLVGPFSVRTQSGAVLAEPAGWNLIADSLGWNDFLYGSGQPVTSTQALLSGSQVMSCAVAEGDTAGPSVSIAAGSAAAVASLWLLLPQDPGCVSAALTCDDSGQSLSTAADMTRRGVWQRISLPLPGRAAPRTVRLRLMLVGQGTTIPPVLTQCWQFEPGTAVTSFIPTRSGPALRAADHIGTVAQPMTTTLGIGAICATVASAIPAATRCGVRLIQY